MARTEYIDRDQQRRAKEAPIFCHDCGKRFEWDDARTIIGDRAYHSDTCGPAPEPTT